MNKTATTTCPRCEEEVTLEWWTERHRVHNGIGMQTVAQDHYREVIFENCEHTEEDLTENEFDQMFDKAAQKLAEQRYKA